MRRSGWHGHRHACTSTVAAKVRTRRSGAGLPPSCAASAPRCRPRAPAVKTENSLSESGNRRWCGTRLCDNDHQRDRLRIRVLHSPFPPRGRVQGAAGSPACRGPRRTVSPRPPLGPWPPQGRLHPERHMPSPAERQAAVAEFSQELALRLRHPDPLPPQPAPPATMEEVFERLGEVLPALHGPKGRRGSGSPERELGAEVGRDQGPAPRRIRPAVRARDGREPPVPASLEDQRHGRLRHLRVR